MKLTDYLSKKQGDLYGHIDTGPKKEDEVVLDNLAITRAMSFIIQRLDRFVAVAFGVLLTFLIVSGLYAWNSSNETNRLTDTQQQIIDARTQARYTTCIRDNEIRWDAGDAAAAKAEDLIRASHIASGEPATEEQTKIEQAYVESQRQVTLDAYPHRDCSDKGIEAYYENPPKVRDPESCVPDDKGLCK